MKYVVNVRYVTEGAVNQIYVDSSEIRLQTPELATDNQVIWNFYGIPNNCYPKILFRVGEVNNLPFGPFAAMIQRPSTVIAVGNRPTVVGSFPYEIAIMATHDDREVNVATRQGLLLVNENTRATTSPIVQVKRGEAAGELKVTPETVTIYSGVPIVWQFEENPDPSWFPQIQFEQANQVENAYFGPFNSLTELESPTGKMVIGSGNNGVPGLFNYRALQIDSQTNEILRESSPDPGVDNGGDPPGGGSG